MSGLMRLFSALRMSPTERQSLAWDDWRRRSTWQDEDKLEALKLGEQVLPDSATVSFGTRGYSLQALERDGFMRRERVHRATPLDEVSWRYTRTAAGDTRLARAALETQPSA